MLHELRELKAPYWFNNDEVARIQQLNQGFMEQKDMAEMITACFRKPKEGETAQDLNGTQILKIISKQYPSVKVSQSARVHLAYALRELGYEQCKTTGNVKYYRLVTLVAA